MNSSQNVDLAIVFRSNSIKVRQSGYRQKSPICSFVNILILSVTLQGCSIIEGVLDGSAFSDASSPPSSEVQSREDTDAQSVEDNSLKIKELKDSPSASVKPLNQSRRVVSTETSKVEVAPTKSIEIMWQVPTEPVVAYHIYLLNGALDGADEKRHFRVLVSGLKKDDDPTYGPVYKYQVPGNLTANTIQIRAENRFGLSEPSEPIVVQK